MARPKRNNPNKELMKRISLTIPKDLLISLDSYVKVFAEGDLKDNRAKFICSLIERNVPTIEE